MTETITVQSDEKTGKNSSRMSSGTLARLRSGGYQRILRGLDLYLSLVIGGIMLLVHFRTSVAIVNLNFISSGTGLAISLTAFILAGLAILVSFSDEKFLALLKELEIYQTLIFNFEFSVYLALTTSVLGIVFTSYSDILSEFGLLELAFFVFAFFFIYMVLAAANLVSIIVSIGDRKARLAMMD